MRIAAHHVPGTSEHAFSQMLQPNPEYTPTCAWPENCTVQWGHGIIPAVPFFEAFPPGTFIRGEGETIAEAELAAFAKYQRDLACEHIWGRQRPGRDLYTNGAGWCRKCGAFRGRMFKPIVALGHWRKPLTRWEYDWINEEPDPDFDAHYARKFPAEAAASEMRKHVLRLRFKLFGGEPQPAQGIEAQRAETGTGSVHESPVAGSDAPKDNDALTAASLRAIAAQQEQNDG